MDYEEESEEERLKRENLVIEEESKDLLDILSRPSGLRFFKRMFEDSLYFSDKLMTGNSMTFFNLGKREFADRMQKKIAKADPVIFTKIFLSIDHK
jgi:hypothetical protein